MGTPNEPIPLEVELPTTVETSSAPAEGADISDQLRSAMASAPPTGFGGIGTAEMAAFACDVEHWWDPGIRTAPRAGPVGTQQAAWRVHGGRGTKTVRWAAAAFDGKPRAPHPSALVPNEVLMDCKVEKPVPGHLANGMAVVVLRGTYVYELLKAPGENDDLSAAANIMTNGVAALQRFRLSEFDKAVLSPGLSSGFNPPAGDLGALI